MKAVYQWLTYAGSLPFIAAATCGLVGLDGVQILGSVITVLSAYGAVIAAFMAGTYWGLHLTLQNAWSSRLAVLSNILAIAIWSGYVMLPAHWFIYFLVIIFLLLLLVDWCLLADNHISIGYFRTRSGVTFVVVISLVATALSAHT